MTTADLARFKRFVLGLFVLGLVLVVCADQKPMKPPGGSGPTGGAVAIGSASGQLTAGGTTRDVGSEDLVEEDGDGDGIFEPGTGEIAREFSGPCPVGDEDGICESAETCAEILLDGAGDDDGLCELGERCIEATGYGGDEDGVAEPNEIAVERLGDQFGDHDGDCEYGECCAEIAGDGKGDDDGIGENVVGCPTGVCQATWTLQDLPNDRASLTLTRNDKMITIRLDGNGQVEAHLDLGATWSFTKASAQSNVQAIARAIGADPAALRTSIDCGAGVVVVPADGSPISIPVPAGITSGACNESISFDFVQASGGAVNVTVTVQLVPPTSTSCLADVNCPAGAYCVDGSCRDGNAGSFCRNNYDCDRGDGLYCTSSACGDGSPGSACMDALDCEDALGSFACVAGLCSAGSTGDGCASDAQCRSGICYQARCQQGTLFDFCTTADDCGSPLPCVSGVCWECQNNSHCPAGSLCISGTCSPANLTMCTSGAQCQSNEYCFFFPPQRCVECRFGSECASGICFGGDCAECVIDIDCPAAHRCDRGTCVSVP